jgi:hypothetical protein
MKSKIIKLIGAIILMGIGYATYIWFMPHRNVQAVTAFETISATDLVHAFVTNKEKANATYLDSDEGESKVLIVTGEVAKISKDQLGQHVVLLKNKTDKMGVSCSFTTETNDQVSNIKIGDTISIKGVIRSGAEYDADLDLIENVIVEKSAMLKK